MKNSDSTLASYKEFVVSEGLKCLDMKIVSSEFLSTFDEAIYLLSKLTETKYFTPILFSHIYRVSQVRLSCQHKLLF